MILIWQVLVEQILRDWWIQRRVVGHSDGRNVEEAAKVFDLEAIQRVSKERDCTPNSMVNLALFHISAGNVVTHLTCSESN